MKIVDNLFMKKVLSYSSIEYMLNIKDLETLEKSDGYYEGDSVVIILSDKKGQKDKLLSGEKLIKECKDKDFIMFSNHTARTYTMEVPPKNINFMDVQYFLPMVGGKIDGYYKVKKVYFGAGGGLRLKLNLSTYIPLGEEQVHIYKTKMEPGELISYETMMKLYVE